MKLILDFDGVVHPDAAYVDKAGKPYLKGPGELFMWCDYLIELLAPYSYDEVEITLVTTWISRLGFAYAKNALPPALAVRVTDAAWRKNNFRETGITQHRWNQMPRFKQVMQYVQRKKLTHWLAVDDTHEGFPVELEHHIVRCKPDFGLSDAATRQSFRDKLASQLARP